MTATIRECPRGVEGKTAFERIIRQWITHV
jgi:hypothetical protein